jgi:hypothetical protein
VIPVHTGSNLRGLPLVSGDIDRGCVRVTSVTYLRQTGGEPLVKGDDGFDRELEKGVECEATGIIYVALRYIHALSLAGFGYIYIIFKQYNKYHYFEFDLKIAFIFSTLRAIACLG